MRGKFDIWWHDRGGPPKSPSNPAYPDGIDLDISAGAERTCTASLPYPTGHKNVGGWHVRCLVCGLQTYVTAASRADDPRSVKLPCKELLQ